MLQKTCLYWDPQPCTKSIILLVPCLSSIMITNSNEFSAPPLWHTKSVTWIQGALRQTAWTYYCPFLTMEVIHINSISRHLKKHFRFYKLQWFWISRKNKNMLVAPNRDKLRCIQAFEKLALKVRFYYILPLAKNLFQNFQLFFLIKESKCIPVCKYLSK